MSMDDKQRFAQLHIPGDPLMIYNIWDAGSAAAVEAAGAKALATGSHPVAGANGSEDGEQLPFSRALDNARAIISNVSVPVSIDMETGYGNSPEEVGRSAKQMASLGVVGANIEDQILGENALRPIDDQVARLSAAVEAGLFVNARTDVFIQTPPQDHDENLVGQALERCHAYSDAGAGSFFAPFLTDEKLIAMLCERAELPVNILMTGSCPPPSRLAELGVARISYGGGVWVNIMKHLEEQAAEVFSGN